MTRANSKGRKTSSPKDDEKKRDVGRPRLIDSPETFDRLVDSYVKICRDSKEPVLLTSMILALGLTSKQSFYEYQNYPEFSDSVKRARMIVEAEYEKRLVTQSNAAGSIFALKNFGWMDKHPSELDELQAQKLKRELHGDEDESTPVSVKVTVQDASKR